MDKWQYIILSMGATFNQDGRCSFSENMSSFNNLINTKGGEGWELVGMAPVTEEGNTKSILFTFKKWIE